MKLFKHSSLFNLLVFTLGISLPSISSASPCQAVCVNLSGYAFQQSDGVFSVSTYHKLKSDSEIYIVKGSSVGRLKELCHGSLLSGYEKEVYIPEQVTPFLSVTEGNYLKNATFYKSRTCLRVVE